MSSARWLVVPALTAALAVPASAGTAVGPRTYTRTCDSAVYGELNADWQKDAVVVGPLSLVWALQYRSAATAPRRTQGFKILAVVEPGATVTVSIPESASSVASLLYRPAKFSFTRARVRDGDTATTLVACEQPNGDQPWQRGTQFNGAFLVYGRRCVPVDIAVAGQPAVRRLVSFGAGTCGGRAAA